MNAFTIIPIGFIIASALWFGWCMASARRGVAIRIVFGIVGGGLFVLIQGLIPKIFHEQVHRLLMEYDDPEVIVGVYIVTAVVVLFLGLVLRSLMRKPID